MHVSAAAAFKSRGKKETSFRRFYLIYWCWATGRLSETARKDMEHVAAPAHHKEDFLPQAVLFFSGMMVIN